MANIDAPKTNEGKSFLPVLKQEKETIREVVYGTYSGGTKPGMRCVKKGDWKLIKYDVMNGQVQETQLFNLAENPNEFIAEHNRKSDSQTNLATNPKFKKQLKEMEELLLSEMKRLDDPYRLWDQPAIK